MAVTLPTGSPLSNTAAAITSIADQPMTLAGWMNLADVAGGYGQLVSLVFDDLVTPANSGANVISFSGGPTPAAINIDFLCYYAGQFRGYQAAAVTPSTWMHLAMVWNPTAPDTAGNEKVKAYINGAQVGTATGAALVGRGNATSFEIGPGIGQAQDVLFYLRELTAGEISALARNRRPRSALAVKFWNPLTNVGSSTTDFSGKGVTLTGGPATAGTTVPPAGWGGTLFDFRAASSNAVALAGDAATGFGGSTTLLTANALAGTAATGFGGSTTLLRANLLVPATALTGFGGSVTLSIAGAVALAGSAQTSFGGMVSLSVVNPLPPPSLVERIMADLTGAGRYIHVDQLGVARPGIDIVLGPIRSNETLVYDGTMLYSRRANSFGIGVYTGAAPAGSTNYPLYMKWIGNSGLMGSDNFASAQWSDIEAPNFIWDGWGPQMQAYPDNWLQLTIPLFPDTVSRAVDANWTAAAGGSQDAHWNLLGDYIVNKGTIKKLIIRLDHEMNIKVLPSTIGNWQVYWRRVVNLLRAKFTAASGITAKFCWNPTNNNSSVDLDLLWPGQLQDASSAQATFDGIVNTSGGSPATTNLLQRINRAYPFRRRMPCPEVDLIGIDIYDQNGSSYVNGVQPTAAQQHEAWWSYLSNFNEFPQSAFNTSSLNYMQVLSRETGVPLCVPEFGCWEFGRGRPAGGDSPIFLYKFHEWAKAANCVYVAHFDYTDVSQDAWHQLWPGQANNYNTPMPLAKAAFLSLF